MAKPRVDMDRLSIPKAAAAAAVPFAGTPSPEPAPPGSGKSLTVKLEAAKRATGQRVTHQQVMVTALRVLLGRRAAA